MVLLMKGPISGGMACAQHLLQMDSMKKILIVEDNSDWRELLGMILGRLGYEVFMAACGEDGVQKASATQPDLILMDLGLPKMSGDEATVRIKSDSATKDIPIVIQTAFSMGPSVERAIKAGAVDIMHKPISIADIQAVLKKHLSGASKALVPSFSDGLPATLSHRRSVNQSERGFHGS